ncbi:MAG: CpsD/CapB family tyrosine-protein kinase [Sporolactobacillus sp.]|nr:CpsD/CapB family tyrosine-protein kinase [Sporolactobacillus sp.]
MKFMRKSANSAHLRIENFEKDYLLAEQYRTLRTNLAFSKAGGGMKTYLVTSAEPRVGKSTTAVNLAIVMAQQGKNVLLIDGDIRKPSLHEAFQSVNRKGLTNLLTGQGQFGQMIRTTNIDRLKLMTSGPVSPDPADLLCSAQMESVLEQAAQTFDQVVIDSPPVLVAADAQLLADLCDGVLLVAKSRSTEIDKLCKAAELLAKARGKLLGAVLNNQKENKIEQYNYHYGNFLTEKTKFLLKR